MKRRNPNTPAKVPVSDLTDHLGYWLRFVSNQVSYTFARKLSDKGVTVAEWVMLRKLYGKNSMLPSHLADEMGVTKGAITKLANRLISQGLIVRNTHPRDARAQTLELTPAGKNLVPTLAKLADKNDAAFFNTLSKGDRETLERILKVLVKKHALTRVPTQ